MSQLGNRYSRRRYAMAAVNINPNDTVVIDVSGGADSGYAMVPVSGSGVAYRTKGVAVAFYDSNLVLLGPATSPVAGQNSTGSRGAMYVEVELGVDKQGGLRSFRRANDTAGGALLQAHVGQNVYAKDGQTATITSTNNSHIGELVAINADGTVEIQVPISY